MKIETKYDIGQEVWFMEDNHTQSGMVTGLRYSYGKGDFFGKAISHEGNVQVNYFLRGEFIHSGRILKNQTFTRPKKNYLKVCSMKRFIINILLFALWLPFLIITPVYVSYVSLVERFSTPISRKIKMYKWFEDLLDYVSDLIH